MYVYLAPYSLLFALFRGHFQTVFNVIVTLTFVPPSPYQSKDAPLAIIPKSIIGFISAPRQYS